MPTAIGSETRPQAGYKAHPVVVFTLSRQVLIPIPQSTVVDEHAANASSASLIEPILEMRSYSASQMISI